MIRILYPIKPLLHYKRMLFIMALIIIVSCKKQSPVNLDERPNNFSEIFMQFWERMNNQYVYWDKDNTDWNAVYTKYKPLFDNLTNSTGDKQRAVVYFKEITTNLIDNHFTINFTDPSITNSSINPAINRKSKTTNFHNRYNYDEVVKKYLDNGYLSGRGNVVNNGTLIDATAGTINSNLLYFHCNFFSLRESYYSNNDNKIKQILTYFFSQLKRTPNPIKGIILDLRNNIGGDIIDLNFFAGKLINHDVTFGYTRGKSGMGKLDYLPWVEAKLKHDVDYAVDVPIILLADNFSASLSETTIIALRNYKNILIGEQTYGATGPLSDTKVFNSGDFSIDGFMDVKTSATEFKGIDGTFYENAGIKPDMLSPFNLKELLAGKDTQLELAISQIK